MDSITASRLTAVLARKTGSEEVAEKIVANVIKHSRKPEPSSAEGAGVERGQLMNAPRFGAAREGGTLDSSNALRDGMKSGGKDSSEVAFEEFIGAMGAPSVAQAPPAPGPANRAILDVSEAFSALSPETKTQLYVPNYLGEYLSALVGEGSKIISSHEERGELSQAHSEALIKICDELKGLAEDVANLAAAAGENKPDLESQSARLEELLGALETLLKEISGREHLFA